MAVNIWQFLMCLLFAVVDVSLLVVSCCFEVVLFVSFLFLVVLRLLLLLFLLFLLLPSSAETGSYIYCADRSFQGLGGEFSEIPFGSNLQFVELLELEIIDLLSFYLACCLNF